MAIRRGSLFVSCFGQCLCGALSLPLGYVVVSSASAWQCGGDQPIAIRLALPPAAAVLTLIDCSASRNSSG